MPNFKGILASLGTIGLVIAAAAFIIQLQCGRIEKLNRKNAELLRQHEADSIYTAALEDTLKGIGEYKPLPESIPVPTPYPVYGPFVSPETVYSDAAGQHPFYCFVTKADYDAWYRQKCTGMITGSDSTIFDKKRNRGARADYHWEYGTGTNANNWLLLLPVGNWIDPIPKKGFAGGMELLFSNKGDLSIGGDLTWRNWGPAARIDIINGGKNKYWGGARRNF